MKARLEVWFLNGALKVMDRLAPVRLLPLCLQTSLLIVYPAFRNCTEEKQFISKVMYKTQLPPSPERTLHFGLRL